MAARNIQEEKEEEEDNRDSLRMPKSVKWDTGTSSNPKKAAHAKEKTSSGENNATISSCGETSCEEDITSISSVGSLGSSDKQPKLVRFGQKLATDSSEKPKKKVKKLLVFQYLKISHYQKPHF